MSETAAHTDYLTITTKTRHEDSRPAARNAA
jgi:hypothetical protein